MNKTEFGKWFDGVHASCFPNVASWLGNIAASDPERARSIKAEWMRQLKAVSYRAAGAASRSLADDGSRDLHPSEHPGEIVRRAIGETQQQYRLPEPRYGINGEPLFACLLCEDSGWRQVYHPKTVAAIRRGVTPSPYLYTCLVACSCNAGDYRANRQNSARYDAARHVLTVKFEEDGDARERIMERTR